jgi:hypothetical protein
MFHLHGRERAGIAVDPSHPFGTGLGAGNIERGRSGFDADNVETEQRKPVCERSRAAPHVEHRSAAELRHDGEVVVEVVSLSIDGVVDRSEARVGEAAVGRSHADGKTTPR